MTELNGARNVTIRLDARRLREWQGVALLDDTSLSSLLRLALDSYLDSRKRDPQLEDKILARQKEVFGALLDAAAPGEQE